MSPALHAASLSVSNCAARDTKLASKVDFPVAKIEFATALAEVNDDLRTVSAPAIASVIAAFASICA